LPRFWLAALAGLGETWIWPRRFLTGISTPQLLLPSFSDRQVGVPPPGDPWHLGVRRDLQHADRGEFIIEPRTLLDWRGWDRLQQLIKSVRSAVTWLIDTSSRSVTSRRLRCSEA